MSLSTKLKMTAVMATVLMAVLWTVPGPHLKEAGVATSSRKARHRGFSRRVQAEGLWRPSRDSFALKARP
jgi:hypothetical protein